MNKYGETSLTIPMVVWFDQNFISQTIFTGYMSGFRFPCFDDHFS